MEYGEYIKYGIIGIVAVAALWFGAKWYLKRK